MLSRWSGRLPPWSTTRVQRLRGTQRRGPALPRTCARCCWRSPAHAQPPLQVGGQPLDGAPSNIAVDFSLVPRPPGGKRGVPSLAQRRVIRVIAGDQSRLGIRQRRCSLVEAALDCTKIIGARAQGGSLHGGSLVWRGRKGAEGDEDTLARTEDASPWKAALKHSRLFPGRQRSQLLPGPFCC